jgi:transposase
LPADPGQLREFAQQLVAREAQLTAALAESSQTVALQQQQLEKLAHELALLKRCLFGMRRERQGADDPRQKTLFEVSDAEVLETPRESDGVAGDEPVRKRPGHGRRVLPQFLPRRREEHPLTEAELGCPCCGQARQKIKEVITEQLEYTPASLHIVEHVQFTYVCKACAEHVVTSEKPPQPIPKGIAGPGLLAHVIAAKYVRHMPLYRLEDDLARYSVLIRRSTLAGWMSGAAECLGPLVLLLKRLVLSSRVLGTDDTHVKLLDPELDHTRRAHFWAYVGDDRHPYVAYDFTESHKRDGPARFLDDYRGVLQADAFSGYDAIYYGSGSQIVEAGCCAHARRKFFEARQTAPEAAHQGLAFFRRLYDVEDQAAHLTSEARLGLRQELSIPILQDFQEWLNRQLLTLRPKSPIALAVKYCLKHWEALTRFVTDGEIPIDNNRTERTLRDQAIGRKNWLFVGSRQGGATAAALYSVVASAKRHQLDPEAYLADVLTELPKMVNPLALRGLLPDRWAKAHPEHVKQHRRTEATAAANRKLSRRERRRQRAK